MSFTRVQARALLRKVEAVVQSALQNDGLVVSVDKGSFGTYLVTMMLTVATKDSKVQSKEAEDFVRYVIRWPRLKVSDLSSTFTFQGVMFKVVGAKPRSKQAPIVCENIAIGTKTRFPAYLVADLLRA